MEREISAGPCFDLDRGKLKAEVRVGKVVVTSSNIISSSGGGRKRRSLASAFYPKTLFPTPEYSIEKRSGEGIGGEQNRDNAGVEGAARKHLRAEAIRLLPANTVQRGQTAAGEQSRIVVVDGERSEIPSASGCQPDRKRIRSPLGVLLLGLSRQLAPLSRLACPAAGARLVRAVFSTLGRAPRSEQREPSSHLRQLMRVPKKTVDN